MADVVPFSAQDEMRVTSFRRVGRAERLYISADPHPGGAPLRIAGRGPALTLLRELAADAWGLAALRRLYAEALRQTSILETSDQAVLDELARRLVTGQLKVRTVELPALKVPPGTIEEAAKAPAKPAAPAPKPETTWFEVLVLFADTGEPVPSVKIKIKLPTGDEATHSTNRQGLIRIDGIKETGECSLSSEVKGLKRSDVVALGAPPSGPPPADEKPRSSQVYQLIEIESYKVKTGDTLDALAKKIGITWRDLAKFNWDTDKPKEINKHLRWDVGCTKKSGKDYIFDDADEPGLVLLPKPVAMKAPTGSQATLNVLPVAVKRPWLFSL